jgi:hypothetical protein
MRIMLAVVIIALLGSLSLAVTAQSTIGSNDYPAQAQGLPLVY